MHLEDGKRFLAAQGSWTQSGLEHLDVRTTAHGDERWVRIFFNMHRTEEGDPGLGVGLIQDIDFMKRQELELIAARAAAEAATRAKSDFLASMSHEIRTPMNGIVGVLHLLKANPNSEDAPRMLDEALTCSAMLGQLINDVLDLSKIEAGKLELAYEPTDAAATLESLLQLLRPQAQAKGLYLRAEIDDGIEWIQTDPIRLRQCLFNLIGNAVKFTGQGGVTVHLRRAGAGRLRLEVTDTGAGLSPDLRTRLFQRFEQADHGTTRTYGGTGLGLAITKHLVELMGGEIGVDSVEGRGATFWLEIEAAPCAPISSTPEESAATLEGLRILLVDDNATNRLVGSKILETLGAEAIVADGGSAAIEAVRSSAFDLVLMDINMPGMDGTEATRIIRAMPGDAGVMPIIALTANVMAEQRALYMAAGMNGLVAKPFSPTSLLTEIVRIFSEDEISAAPETRLAG
jgi:signal transduction histidine kinase/CheY-like chemotaxis protein